MLGEIRQYIIIIMLESLQLRSFILVQSLSLDFGSGFNVMTGETGAGKSVIVKALALLAGQSASPDYIYPDESHAFIEGVFRIPSGVSLPNVEGDESTLIVSRKIYRDRATVNKMNGESVTLKQLKKQ